MDQKQASRGLLSSLQELLKPMQDWTQKEATQAEVKVFILDTLYKSLPQPPFTVEEIEKASENVYSFVWQKSASHAAV
jgi:type I restriction enzyme R subunit